MKPKFCWSLVTAVLVGAMASGVPIAVGSTSPPAANVSNLDTDVRNEVLRWGTDGSTTKAVFRYRVDELSTATGSVCGSIRCGIEKAGEPTFGTLTRPAPFRDFKYLTLDGVNDAVLGTSSLVTETTLGFTVMVWFRSTNPGQVKKLFSTTENYQGFALTYNAGLLRGTFSFRPDGHTGPATAANRHSVSQPTDSPYRVDDGKWHLVTFTTARIPISGIDPGYQARTRLYVDGVQVNSPADYLTFPGTDFSFWDSTSIPVVGAEPENNLAGGEFFQGDINAAVVYNYQVDHNVLAVRPPYDGDLMYLGMPSYFDYLVAQETQPDGTSGTWNYAHRFTASERDSRWSADVTAEQARVAMPLISANYVPQGVAISEDGQTLYNFFYYSTEDPNNQNPDGGLCGTPCPDYALTTTDLNTQKVTAIYHLNGMPGNHAGGVVATHNRIYVGDLGGGASRTIRRFNLADAQLQAAGNAVHDVPPIYAVSPDGSYNWDPGNLYPDASNSALAYSPATQSIHAMGYYTAGESEFANRIFELPVDASGAVATAPSRTFQLPTSSPDTYGYNQGVTPIPGTTDCFLISHQDRANSSSQLVRWCSGGSWTVERTLPGVTENLAIGPDGMVWVSNENAARKWQKRPTGQWWDRFTPYIAGIPLALL